MDHATGQVTELVESDFSDASELQGVVILGAQASRLPTSAKNPLKLEVSFG